MSDPLAPISPDEAPARMIIGAARKDGMIPVSFVFPSSGRTFRRILTPSRVKAEIAGNYYVVSGFVPKG